MKNPLVSVIIPVYNAEETIKAAVKSLKLEGDTFEIILVNDGSKDHSLDICRKIAAENPQVLVFDQPNGGASSARNLGIQKSKGKYICFLDSDDEVAPEFLPRLLDLIRDDEVALAGTGLWRRRSKTKSGKKREKQIQKSQRLYAHPACMPEKNESLSEYVLYLLNLDGRLYPVVNKIFRGDIIRKNHLGFDPTLDFAEDTKFVLEYLNFAQGKIVFTEEPLYIYNQDLSNGTVGQSSLYWRNWKKSLNFVRDWVKRNSAARETTVLERERLEKLEKRWQISHALAVGRSGLSFIEKCKLVNPFLVIPSTIIAKIRG